MIAIYYSLICANEQLPAKREIVLDEKGWKETACTANRIQESSRTWDTRFLMVFHCFFKSWLAASLGCFEGRQMITREDLCNVFSPCPFHNLNNLPLKLQGRWGGERITAMNVCLFLHLSGTLQLWDKSDLNCGRWHRGKDLKIYPQGSYLAFRKQ